MRRSFAVTAVVALTATLLVGCSDDNDDPPGTLSSQDVVGEWVEPGADPVVSLELMSDGTVTGTDGCNRLTGTWEIDDASVDFGDLAATMMACEGVDTWLSGAESATLSGDELTIIGDNDVVIGTLERS